MNVKAALTRKYGPLPAWGWFIIFGLGVWYYRRKFGAVSTGTGTGSVAQSGPTPGTGEQVLQPGESVYDPTAGTLTTAPGGGGASGGGASGDPTGFQQAIDDLANAIATGMPPQQVVVTGGDNSPQGGHKKPPKLQGKGAIRAPFGHNKPTGKKGYTVKGLGHGFWEYVPKAKAKSKGQGKPQIQSGSWRSSAKSAARSTASIRKNSGGRTTAKQSKPQGHSNAGHTSHAPVQNSRARQRPKTPAVTSTIRQRTVATHPAPTTQRHGAAPAPRPSAPGPRTQRSPARTPPRPAARKRK